LKDVDKETYEKVQRLMDYHFSIRHLRGGEATKRKYKQSKTPV
jgi:sporulation transcriptional regulator SpoIIID